MRLFLGVTVWIALLVPVASGDEIECLGNVEFQGVDDDLVKDFSAVAVLQDGELLVLGADEGAAVQVLRRTADNRYTLQEDITLLEIDPDEELDIEGAACRGNTVVVLGSHSRKRSQVKEDKTHEKNHQRLTENEREKTREHLFRFKLDSDGRLASTIKPASLRERIEDDKILEDFIKIPSKENGVDMEAVALQGDSVVVGFRGPVLRGGYVPVLVFDFERPEKAKMRFANLGGRGFRDLVAVDGGFLLIGGPVGDAPVSYELYCWDGNDCVPGEDIPPPSLPQSLGRIPLPSSEAKAEGLTVLKETDSHYEVLIVFDGVAEKNAARFRVNKPGS